MATKNIRWHVNSMGDMIPVFSLLEQGANILLGGVRKRMQHFGPRTGKKYKRKGTGMTRDEGVMYRQLGRLSGERINKRQMVGTMYTASAPGEPPQIVERSLLRGMGKTKVKVDKDAVFSIGVGSNAMSGDVHYPAVLEMGTKDGSIKPRPAWRVTLENPEIQKKIMDLFKNKALRRKAGAGKE